LSEIGVWDYKVLERIYELNREGKEPTLYELEKLGSAKLVVNSVKKLVRYGFVSERRVGERYVRIRGKEKKVSERNYYRATPLGTLALALRKLEETFLPGDLSTNIYILQLTSQHLYTLVYLYFTMVLAQHSRTEDSRALPEALKPLEEPITKLIGKLLYSLLVTSFATLPLHDLKQLIDESICRQRELYLKFYDPRSVREYIEMYRKGLMEHIEKYEETLATPVNSLSRDQVVEDKIIEVIKPLRYGVEEILKTLCPQSSSVSSHRSS